MERAVALKKLGKLLGKNLDYRVDPKAPSAEDRAWAKAQLPEAVAMRDTIKKKRDARYEAILQADKEYQQLKAECKEAQKRVDHLSSMCHWYKFTVGNSNSLFFQVKAQGDSWEDVIAKLTKEGR